MTEPKIPLYITFNCSYTLDIVPNPIRVLDYGTLNPAAHTTLTYDTFAEITVHCFTIPLSNKSVTLSAPLQGTTEGFFTYRAFTFSLST